MENEVSIIRAKASLEDRRMRGKEILHRTDRERSGLDDGRSICR